MKPTALTIASSDSSCGAGITRDLSVFHDHGIYGFCSVCTVTSQNSSGVRRIFTVSPRIVSDQIDCILKDIRPSATKIGMVYSRQAYSAVFDRIKKYNLSNIVIDTPRISKNSRQIITAGGFQFLKKHVLPLADVITPNVDEVEALCGFRVCTPEDSREACRILYDMGAKNVIVKGGHLDTPVDVLFTGDDYYEADGVSYGRRVHGTGCTFSAAICAQLALGKTVAESFFLAKDYINKEMLNAGQLGKNDLYYFM